MNGTYEPNTERRTGTERRRNLAKAYNPAQTYSPTQAYSPTQTYSPGSTVVPPATVVENTAVAVGARRISWGAVFAGVVLALITQLVLTLAGLSLGLGTGDRNLGRGTGIWMVVTTIISLFVGGAVAGRLAGLSRRDGALHGLLTWALMALIAIYLTTTAVGRALNMGALNLPSGLTQMGGRQTSTEPNQPGTQPMGAAARNNAMQAVGTEAPNTAGELVTVIENSSPESQSGESAALERLRARGDAPLNSFDREDAVTAVVDRTGRTREEAKGMVDGWLAHGRSAIGESRPAPVTEDTGNTGIATRARNMAGATSFWALIGLCVGAVAAALGGLVGAPGERHGRHHHNQSRHSRRRVTVS